jgi:hypothetical protein
MPFEQDVYRQVCDAALACYAAQHPGAHPYDGEAQQTVKLACYLCIWDDYYGEGLWPIAADHAQHLQDSGCADPLWPLLSSINIFANRHALNDADIDGLDQLAETFAKGGYPPALKFWAYNAAIHNLITAKTDPNLQLAVGRSLGALPDLVTEAVACFRDMIKQHLSHVCLYRTGEALLHVAEKDEPALQHISTGFDQAFAAADKGNPQADVLDGQFYIQYAWFARGVGYANTVTDPGWQRFGERLARASDILNGVYTNHPQEPGTAESMMTVVLGQGGTRDQMELWFQRGQQVEGDLFSLYMSKRYYLLPKWYGSDDAVWNFGLECAKSTNWAAKIPVLLAESILDRAYRDSSIYAKPEIWTPLETVYRDFLTRYPDSVHYRSLFALNAAQGGHWDVAKEQFNILGDAWDRKISSDSLHDRMKSQAETH